LDDPVEGVIVTEGQLDLETVLGRHCLTLSRDWLAIRKYHTPLLLSIYQANALHHDVAIGIITLHLVNNRGATIILDQDLSDQCLAPVFVILLAEDYLLLREYFDVFAPIGGQLLNFGPG